MPSVWDEVSSPVGSLWVQLLYLPLPKFYVSSIWLLSVLKMWHLKELLQKLQSKNENSKHIKPQWLQWHWAKFPIGVTPVESVESRQFHTRTYASCLYWKSQVQTKNLVLKLFKGKYFSNHRKGFMRLHRLWEIIHLYKALGSCTPFNSWYFLDLLIFLLWQLKGI